jgi:HSP20 family protein
MTFGDWEVFGDLTRLRRSLNGHSEAGRPGRYPTDQDGVWVPPVDIYEEDEALVLLVDLPGLTRDGIDLTIHQDSLTLEGERAAPDGCASIRLERPMGRFRRSFRMRMPVDPASVQATYRHGVLRIRLPRSAPRGPTRVSVNVK